MVKKGIKSVYLVIEWPQVLIIKENIEAKLILQYFEAVKVEI